MKFKNFSYTHPGHIREVNEDSYYVSDEKSLWIVCDGMGGHTEGNFASRLVTDIFEDFDTSGSFEDNIELIHKQIEIIHQILISKADEYDADILIGTTLILLYIEDTKAVCIHLGDSRCYNYKNDKFLCITNDHSMEIEKDNEMRKVLTSAISSNIHLDIETTVFEVDEYDRFLLCSDGLYENIEDWELKKIIQDDNMVLSSEDLIYDVLNTKAHDNITFIQVRFDNE